MNILHAHTLSGDNDGDVIPFAFVGDKTFPFRHDLLWPYLRSRHGWDLTDYDKIYNYCPSRARWIIENPFAILAQRFHVNRGRSILSPDVVNLVW